jgi:hypothetical protein
MKAYLTVLYRDRGRKKVESVHGGLTPGPGKNFAIRAMNGDATHIRGELADIFVVDTEARTCTFIESASDLQCEVTKYRWAWPKDKTRLMA